MNRMIRRRFVSSLSLALPLITYARFASARATRERGPAEWARLPESRSLPGGRLDGRRGHPRSSSQGASEYGIYAALRTGGVWKSSNGGVTFEPVMDSQSVYSMGAIAVAPSDEDVVWAGTGDNSATRSAYWGDGVYKSTDGGKTWRNMGLKDTQHIARIVIHPTRPDTVYVAALGHLSTPNTERGVFKTTDGGATWKKVLYVGDRVGAVDLVRDPRDPEVLYAATYEHTRLPWVINDGGPGTGIYKTTDGGANWKEFTNGLPKGPMGRIGIDICRSKPDTLYAVYDNHNLRPGAT